MDPTPRGRARDDRFIEESPHDSAARRAFGNYVLIEHGTGEYSLLAHLKANSETVGVNDRVNQDQLLGRIGFSGDTGLHVHIHYQLSDGPAPMAASSLPVYFSGHRLLASGRKVMGDGLLHTGELIER